MSQQIDRLYGLQELINTEYEQLANDEKLAINTIIQERIDILREEWCAMQDEVDGREFLNN
jgi:hypothetical protein